MARYGSNALAVMFQENPGREVEPNKSQAMPAHHPDVAWFMPGGKTPKGKGIKSLRSPKWTRGASRGKHKRKSAAKALMT